MLFLLKNIIVYFLCFFIIYAVWLCCDIIFKTSIQPYIPLLTLSYWAVYRPSLFHPILIFGFSLFYDFLLNNMLGFSSVIFLLVYFILRSQRQFFLGQTHLALFAVLTLIVSVYGLIQWSFLSLMNHYILPYESFFHNVVISILLLPLLSSFFLGLRKVFSLEVESHRV